MSPSIMICRIVQNIYRNKILNCKEGNTEFVIYDSTWFRRSVHDNVFTSVVSMLVCLSP